MAKNDGNYVLAIVKKGKFSNSWEYLECEDGDTKRFETKEQAAEYALDNNINAVVIEL